MQMVAKTHRRQVKCTECGAQIIRNVPLDRDMNFFCSNVCKGGFQKKTVKPVTKIELNGLYWTYGLDCVQIGKIYGKDPKTIWKWMKDWGLETRPRGSDERQLFKPGHEICKGRVLSDAHKEKLRQARIADGSKCFFRPNGDHVLKGKTGKDHPSWKGGSTPERQAFYASDEWRSACVSVWHRADAKCERCGLDHREIDRTKKKFHVHHVFSFTRYPDYRSDVDNLMLLCEKCHRWVHSRKNVDRLYIKEANDEGT